MKKCPFPHLPNGGILIAVGALVALVGAHPGWSLEQPVAPAQPQDRGKAVEKPKLLAECDIPGLQKTINFNTPDQMDVVNFIKVLASAEVGGDLNVVFSTKVGGTVKLMLKDVTVGDALQIALAANNLAYEIKGAGQRSIVNIMTDEEYAARHGASFYEQKMVKIVELKYAKPSRVNKMLDGVRSQIGRTIFDDTSGTLVLIDTPAKIAEMEGVIAKAELPTIERQLPTETRVFRLQYANVADVQKEMEASLTPEVGKLTANPQSKTLIVTDLPHSLAKIERIVEAFDRKPKQVAVLAKFVQVRLKDEFAMGVDWTHLLEAVNPRFSLNTALPLKPAADRLSSTANMQTLTYKTIAAGGDLTLLIKALRTVGDTKIITNPNVSVLDGQEATIKVITRQPWKEMSFESGTTNVVGVTYKWEEVGAILSVTPKINDNGFITVNIKPTISSIEGWYDYPAADQKGVVGIPVVKKSEASTTVTVKDGVTIIIGGMIETLKERDVSYVPILGRIPLIGALFRSTVDLKTKSETVVFLTPVIVSGEEPFLQIPDPEKEPKLRTSASKESK